MTEKLTKRVLLLMEPSELQALDDWRSVHQVWSRGEAIRTLVERGIKPASSVAVPEATGHSPNRPQAPPGPYPWDQVGGAEIADLNTRIPAQLKRQLDWIVEQGKKTDRTASLKKLVIDALQDYANHELRSHGVPL